MEVRGDDCEQPGGDGARSCGGMGEAGGGLHIGGLGWRFFAITRGLKREVMAFNAIEEGQCLRAEEGDDRL